MPQISECTSARISFEICLPSFTHNFVRKYSHVTVSMIAQYAVAVIESIFAEAGQIEHITHNLLFDMLEKRDNGTHKLVQFHL